jgi:hypothetical protein
MLHRRNHHRRLMSNENEDCWWSVVKVNGSESHLDLSVLIFQSGWQEIHLIEMHGDRSWKESKGHIRGGKYHPPLAEPLSDFRGRGNVCIGPRLPKKLIPAIVHPELCSPSYYGYSDIVLTPSCRVRSSPMLFLLVLVPVHCHELSDSEAGGSPSHVFCSPV